MYDNNDSVVVNPNQWYRQLGYSGGSFSKYFILNSFNNISGL